MHALSFIFFSCVSLAGIGLASEKKIPRIGIIGAGVGGTSCAFFLKSLFGEENVSIDVYEAGKVGGRLSVVEFSDGSFEEGGSIIHSRNKYMVDFLNQFNLSKRHSPGGYFALYDGKEFLFTESEWQIVTFWKVMYRYGLGFWKLRSYIDDMLTKFERIYELQKMGETFNTVGSMLTAMDPKFADYLHVTTKNGFESQGISKIIVDEIIMATIRANYGQNLNIPKMVGSVSVAGAIGGLWAVHGGNVKIPRCLLKASKANFINLAVDSVRRTASGEFQVTTKPGGSSEEGAVEGTEGKEEQEEESRFYDVVVVAAPQTSDSRFKIDFQGFDEEIRFPGRYHKTVCTLIKGTLCRSHFPESSPALDEILTTRDEVPFNSIGKITPVDYSPRERPESDVWKVFTQNRMEDGEVSALFSEVRGRRVREWLAYPHYETEQFRNDSFVLAPRLYHINAIEWAASAMEMSVIGAKNVALLARKDLDARRQAGSPHSPQSRDEL